MALLAGLTYKERLAGVFSLSGYLVMREGFMGLLEEAQGKEGVEKVKKGEGVEVFMGHGEEDPTVKFEWGTMTRDVLKEWGWKIEWRGYKDLDHSVATEEMDDLEGVLKKWIGNE